MGLPEQDGGTPEVLRQVTLGSPRCGYWFLNKADSGRAELEMSAASMAGGSQWN